MVSISASSRLCLDCGPNPDEKNTSGKYRADTIINTFPYPLGHRWIPAIEHGRDFGAGWRDVTSSRRRVSMAKRANLLPAQFAGSVFDRERRPRVGRTTELPV